MGFEKLQQMVEIKVSYTTKSCLAVGAGREVSFEATDSPVVKVGNQPIIPGSTLKGVIRSTLESLLAQEGVKVCIPSATIPKSVRKNEQEDYVHSIDRKMPCGINELCPVCEIFGTTAAKEGLSGRAIFLDARTEEPLKSEHLVERTHVAITRDTKSQAGGKLMSVQAVDAGIKFKGTIRLINPKEWQVGGILQALEITKMLGIGSKKTSGYGEVDIEIDTISIKNLKEAQWQESQGNAQEYKDAFVNILPILKTKRQKVEANYGR